MAKTAEQKSADEAKAAKEAERKAAAEKREQERAEKAKEREAAKAKAAEERKVAQAAKNREKIEKVLSELPEDKRPAITDELTLEAARKAVKDHKAEERANRPKKAPLTLSQRRAVLNLGDAGEAGIVPKTGFNALPLDYLVGVGIAEKFDTKKTVTETSTVEKEVEIPEAERKEGGPTTRTVKEKVSNDVEKDAVGYRLTELGQERVKEINPKWQTWRPAAEATDTAQAS